MSIQQIQTDETIWMLSKSTREEIEYVSKVLKANRILNEIDTKPEKEQKRGNHLALLRIIHSKYQVVDLVMVSSIDSENGAMGFKDVVLDLHLEETKFSYNN